MWPLVSAVTAFFDGLIGLFGGMNPLVGLTVVSVLTGGIMLVIFRYTSNQEAIARAKGRIKAYILEVRLFQDDLGLQMAAQRRILATNMNYMRHALTPMLVMLVPVLIILIQLDVRYAHRPFHPGEKTIVKVRLDENADPSALTMRVPDGLVAETPPLRIAGEREVDWRIRVEKEGTHELSFDLGGETAMKRVIAGGGLIKLAQGRYVDGALALWTHPAEPPLPKDARIRSIEIAYPERNMALWGVNLHWLLVFFVVSVVFGFAIKGWVGVEV
ncbi:MAG: hypothetical protein JW958_09975 [Candidatus Eisenbacteria bacterium]|nr:hypothetical protein [Candidatus Eisenbacteria bacterium]